MPTPGGTGCLSGVTPLPVGHSLPWCLDKPCLRPTSQGRKMTPVHPELRPGGASPSWGGLLLLTGCRRAVGPPPGPPHPCATVSGQLCSLSQPLGCLSLTSLGSGGGARPAEGPGGGEQGGLYVLGTQPRRHPQTARLSWMEGGHGTAWLSWASRPGLERPEAQRRLEKPWALMARDWVPPGTALVPLGVAGE